MTAWSRELSQTALHSNGWLVSSRDIDYAVQFELTNGVKVNLYDTGRLSFGGPKGAFKSEVETPTSGAV